MKLSRTAQIILDRMARTDPPMEFNKAIGPTACKELAAKGLIEPVAFVLTKAGRKMAGPAREANV